MYKESKGDMLLARLISYSEVCFILAEAAQKGWSVGGTQQDGMKMELMLHSIPGELVMMLLHILQNRCCV